MDEIEAPLPQLGAGVTSGARVKKPAIGLEAVEHAAADWWFAPLAWLDSAASPMFEMSNVLRHTVHLARPGS